MWYIDTDYYFILLVLYIFCFVEALSTGPYQRYRCQLPSNNSDSDSEGFCSTRRCSGKEHCSKHQVLLLPLCCCWGMMYPVHSGPPTVFLCQGCTTAYSALFWMISWKLLYTFSCSYLPVATLWTHTAWLLENLYLAFSYCDYCTWHKCDSI